MTIYIKLKKNELVDARTNVLNMRSSFSNIEKRKTKFKFLEKEKQELKKEVSDNFRYILDLIEKIEKNLPRAESPYVKQELTEKGITVKPILEIKTEKDYIKELKSLNTQLNFPHTNRKFNKK
jgi:hypothetical protein